MSSSQPDQINHKRSLEETPETEKPAAKRPRIEHSLADPDLVTLLRQIEARNGHALEIQDDIRGAGSNTADDVSVLVVANVVLELWAWPTLVLALEEKRFARPDARMASIRAGVAATSDVYYEDITPLIQHVIKRTQAPYLAGELQQWKRYVDSMGEQLGRLYADLVDAQREARTIFELLGRDFDTLSVARLHEVKLACKRPGLEVRFAHRVGHKPSPAEMIDFVAWILKQYEVLPKDT